MTHKNMPPEIRATLDQMKGAQLVETITDILSKTLKNIMKHQKEHTERLLAERDAAIKRLEERLANVERGLDVVNRVETLTAAAEARVERNIANLRAEFGAAPTAGNGAGRPQ